MERPYKLWLDDLRPAPSPDWVVCKNRVEFERAIRTLGTPYILDLDHDLGDPDPETDGYACIKWFLDNLPEGNYTFETRCHSSNPVGWNNIMNYVRGWRKSCSQ
jgi:hypothetical protein